MQNFIEVKPFYSELESPVRIYRNQFERERYYFASKEGKLFNFPSVTTILDQVLPTEQWLIQWIAKWGWERAIEKREQAALYGTFFSFCVADFLRAREFDLDTIPLRIREFNLLNPEADTRFWEKRIKEDLIAISEFFADHQFEPLAIELPLCSFKYGFAGTIDAIGYMKIGSGVNGKLLKKDKEVEGFKKLVIIDWKTGRNGFHRSHEAQLHMYSLLFQENFEKYGNNIRLFNWAPKEWEQAEDTKYTLKEQTYSTEAQNIEHYLAIFKSKNHSYFSKRIQGILRLGEPPNSNYEIFDLLTNWEEK